MDPVVLNSFQKKSEVAISALVLLLIGHPHVGSSSCVR